MSKSKYPDSIDTSIELPIVRDNIIQIGAEAVNSLRSAILQVEKTLGTNPNGIPSITLAERLNKSLDDLGNIKKEAIKALNLISGPITNSEVSDNANIEESKLKLDYRTSTLYGQILSLQSQISAFIQTINDLSLKISIHLNADALNAHEAKNIGVKDITISASDISNLELSSKNVQEVLEQIINNHINYTGENISSTNNAHSADRIFYDSLASGIAASSVQEAIDSLSGQGSDVGQNLKDLYFSNGYQKTSKLGVQQNLGRVIAENISVSFSKYNEVSDDNFSLISYVDTLVETPEKYDFIVIFDTVYQIHSIDLVNKSIKIYGNLLRSSIVGQTATLIKNNHQPSSFAGLKLVPVYNTNLSFCKNLKILNPSGTYVVSENVYPDKISPSNQTFTIEIDNLISHTFSVNNPSKNTIDSVIEKINQECSLENLPISAFRLDTQYGAKIGLSVDFANTDQKIYYIKLTSSDNSLDYLGFSKIKNLKVYGNFGSSFQINGNDFKNFKTKVISSDFIINAGNNTIDLTESDLTVLDLGVKKNNLIQIEGSSANDGIYRITSVNNSTIEVDIKSGSSFSADTSTTTVFRIQENSVGFDDISYENISTGGFETSIIDIFMDENQEVLFKQVLEYESVISGTTPLYSIIQIPRDLEDKNYSLQIDLINTSNKDEGFIVTLDGNQTLVDIPLGEKVLNLRTDDNKYIKIKFSVAGLLTNLDTNGSISTNLYFKKSINYKHNLFLGRVRFDDFRNLITGVDATYKQLENCDKGFVSEDEITDEFLNKIIYRRFAETRSSGVIVGLDITNVTLSSSSTYEFTVSSGICYINGKRFELLERTIVSTISVATSDKIFIGVDSNGDIATEEPIKVGSPAVCISPFDGNNVLTLGTIEYNPTPSSSSSLGSFVVFDLKLNISDIDLKIFNDIIVSPIEGAGHFTKLSKALKIAKRFGEIFPNAGIPKIKLKAGTYKESISINDSSINTGTDTTLRTNGEFGLIEMLAHAESGIYIDFPVIIEGEGEGTVLDLEQSYTNTAGQSKLTQILNRGAIVIMGNVTEHSSPDYSVLPPYPNATSLTGNVIIKNLKLYNSKIVTFQQFYQTGGGLLSYRSEVVTLENIFFESDTTWGYGVISTYYMNIASNETSGNININNCRFDNCGILVTNVRRNYYQNYQIKDCFFRRESAVTVPSNPDDYAAIYLSEYIETVESALTGSNFLSIEGASVINITYLISSPSSNIPYDSGSFPKKGSAPGKYYFNEINVDTLNVSGSSITAGTTDFSIFAKLAENQTFSGDNGFYGTNGFYGNTLFADTVFLGTNSYAGANVFSAATTFNGATTFTALSTFNDNVTVSGAISTYGLAVSDSAIFNDNVTFSNNVTVLGAIGTNNLAVSGPAIFSNNVTVSGAIGTNNLAVNGPATFSNNVTVSGAIGTNNLVVTGPATFTNNVTISGDLTLNGDVYGKVIQSKSCAFHGLSSDPFFLGTLNGDIFNRSKNNLVTLFISHMHEGAIFVPTYKVKIQKILFRNHTSDAITGALHIFVSDSGDTYDYVNFTTHIICNMLVAGASGASGGLGYATLPVNAPEIHFGKAIAFVVEVTSSLVKNLSLTAEIAYTYEVS